MIRQLIIVLNRFAVLAVNGKFLWYELFLQGFIKNPLNTFSISVVSTCMLYSCIVIWALQHWSLKTCKVWKSHDFSALSRYTYLSKAGACMTLWPCKPLKDKDFMHTRRSVFPCGSRMTSCCLSTDSVWIITCS